jgi:hypothetical protein
MKTGPLFILTVASLAAQSPTAAQNPTFAQLSDLFRNLCETRLGKDCTSTWTKAAVLLRTDYIAGTMNHVSDLAKLRVSGDLPESTFNTYTVGDQGVIRFNEQQCDDCFTRCKDISNDLEKGWCNTKCYAEPGRAVKIAACNAFNLAIAGKIIGHYRLKDLRISAILNPTHLSVNCSADLACSVGTDKVDGSAKMSSGTLEYSLEIIPAAALACLPAPAQFDASLPGVDFRFPNGAVTADGKLGLSIVDGLPQFQWHMNEINTTLKLHVPDQFDPIKGYFLNRFKGCPLVSAAILVLSGAATQIDLPVDQKIPAADSPIKLGTNMKLDLPGGPAEYQWSAILNDRAVGAVATKKP